MEDKSVNKGLLIFYKKETEIELLTRPGFEFTLWAKSFHIGPWEAVVGGQSFQNFFEIVDIEGVGRVRAERPGIRNVIWRGNVHSHVFPLQPLLVHTIKLSPIKSNIEVSSLNIQRYKACRESIL